MGGWQGGSQRGTTNARERRRGPSASVRVDLENQAEQGKENCKKNEQTLKMGIQ